MITTTFSTLPGILHYVAQLCLLAGVGLIMFVPFFPGLAVMLAGVLAYVGYQSFMAKTLAGIDAVTLGMIVGLTVIGLTSSWWSEKLGMRFTYLNQQAMWGAIIGSFIGIFLFGMLGMLIGLILGTMVMELRGGKPFADSLRQGVASLLSMLGPRGFQLVMALLVGGLALSHMGR
jgi:uncharacterized protein YqgC (DUF456 family)